MYEHNVLSCVSRLSEIVFSKKFSFGLAVILQTRANRKQGFHCLANFLLFTYYSHHDTDIHNCIHVNK